MTSVQIYGTMSGGATKKLSDQTFKNIALKFAGELTKYTEPIIPCHYSREHNSDMCLCEVSKWVMCQHNVKY